MWSVKSGRSVRVIALRNRCDTASLYRISRNGHLVGHKSTVYGKHYGFQNLTCKIGSCGYYCWCRLLPIPNAKAPISFATSCDSQASVRTWPYCNSNKSRRKCLCIWPGFYGNTFRSRAPPTRMEGMLRFGAATEYDRVLSLLTNVTLHRSRGRFEIRKRQKSFDVRALR